jgi:hypothetical protein
VARVRHSFEIEAMPEEAQAMFVRDILPSLYKGSAFRLCDEQPGLLVFSDGVVDVNRRFDPRRAANAGPPPRRPGEQQPRPDPPRPRMLGVVLAPNVEHRQPWLYASLRRLSSRKLTVRFDAEEGRTRVRISGSAERRVRHALSRLGRPGQWPRTSGAPDS